MREISDGHWARTPRNLGQAFGPYSTWRPTRRSRVAVRPWHAWALVALLVLLMVWGAV